MYNMTPHREYNHHDDSNNDENQIGEWEAHTKGVGSKLLAKWGYKKGQGLGKDRQGIATPITPISSPQKHMSLDYVLEFNNFIKTEFSSPSFQDNEDELTNKFSKVNIKDKKHNNNKNSVKDLEHGFSSISLSKGPPKVDKFTNDSNYHNYTYSEKDNNYDDNDYNNNNNNNNNNGVIPKNSNQNYIRVLDNITTDLDQIIRRSELSKKKTSIQLSEQTTVLRNLRVKEREQAEKTNKLALEIEQTNKFSRYFENWITAFKEDPVHFARLKERFPLEFSKYKIYILAENVLCKEIEYISSEWDYKEGFPSFFSKWKPILNFSQCTKFWNAFLPTIERIVRKWKPRKDDSFAFLQLTEDLKPLMPPTLFKTALLPRILRKLSKCIRKWKPSPSKSGKGVALHTCLFVWGPILGIEWMDVLFEMVAKKLEDMLKKKEEVGWPINDARIISVISPWTQIFSEPSMDKIQNFLETKCISAIQNHAITRNIPTTEDGERIEGFEWSWIPMWVSAGLVKTDWMASILCYSFFPAWCDFICEWIKTGGDLEEIERYYRFWKQLFHNEFITKGYLIDIFMEVLRLMYENIPKLYLK